MKRIIVSFIILTLLVPKHVEAQNNGAAVAAVATGIAAIGIGIAAIEDLKEQTELRGTQWLLEHHPEISSFSLKTLDFEGKKFRDMSNTSVITYKMQEFRPGDNPVLDGKKQVLFLFTSFGWINEQGVLDYSKVNWYLIDSEEWMKMMVAYAKVSSAEKNEDVLRASLTNGLIVNKGIKVKNKLEIPFFKLEGDMYLVSDYSSEMRLVYNENSLGIFIKKTGDLVQMKRGTVIDIHEFLFDKK